MVIYPSSYLLVFSLEPRTDKLPAPVRTYLYPKYPCFKQVIYLGPVHIPSSVLVR